MWPNPQFPTDLVTFIEEIRNGKLQFLCSAGKVALAIHIVNNISCITCAWALYKTISNSNIHLSKLVRTHPSPTAIIKQRDFFQQLSVSLKGVFQFIFLTEAATGGFLEEKEFWEISQNSQENTCARDSFLIKL